MRAPSTVVVCERVAFHLQYDNLFLWISYVAGASSCVPPQPDHPGELEGAEAEEKDRAARDSVIRRERRAPAHGVLMVLQKT